MRGKKTHFLPIKNPLHIRTTNIILLTALVIFDYSKLFYKCIELKNNINIKAILNEKREKKE